MPTPGSNGPGICWPLPPVNWHAQLGASAPPCEAIHVWASLLDIAAEQVETLSASLAPDERERADRFRFPIHQRRFIAGRGLLRRLLATYLSTDPGSLKFICGTNGKPALDQGKQTLHFNLAHAEDLLLIAVTRNGPVGIDAESVRVLPDAEDLVVRFFSPNECTKFQKLDSAQRPQAFFNLWTRKEAWLKATGEGITHLLNQVEVSFLPGEPARLLRLPESYQKGSLWSLYELAPRHGFVAALAVGGDGHHVDCWHYQAV